MVIYKPFVKSNKLLDNKTLVPVPQLNPFSTFCVPQLKSSNCNLVPAFPLYPLVEAFSVDIPLHLAPFIIICGRSLFLG